MCVCNARAVAHSTRCTTLAADHNPLVARQRNGLRRDVLLLRAVRRAPARERRGVRLQRVRMLKPSDAGPRVPPPRLPPIPATRACRTSRAARRMPARPRRTSCPNSDQTPPDSREHRLRPRAPAVRDAATASPPASRPRRTSTPTRARRTTTCAAATPACLTGTSCSTASQLEVCRRSGWQRATRSRASFSTRRSSVDCAS